MMKLSLKRIKKFNAPEIFMELKKVFA